MERSLHSFEEGGLYGLEPPVPRVLRPGKASVIHHNVCAPPGHVSERNECPNFCLDGDIRWEERGVSTLRFDDPQRLSASALIDVRDDNQGAVARQSSRDCAP